MLIARTATSIPCVTGPVRVRMLRTRTDYELLSQFTVGDETRSEREVMTVVKSAVNEVSERKIIVSARSSEIARSERGSRSREVLAAVRKVVVLEATSGSWLGVSVLSPRGKAPF